jgi:hypothetical protein
VTWPFGDKTAKQRRIRIRLTLAAYAYEFKNNSTMSDAEFDELSKQVDVFQRTGNDVLDDFFEKEFETDTGQWIQKHPDLPGVDALYFRWLLANAGLTDKSDLF